jgi:hypothetical protein
VDRSARYGNGDPSHGRPAVPHRPVPSKPPSAGVVVFCLAGGIAAACAAVAVSENDDLDAKVAAIGRERELNAQFASRQLNNPDLDPETRWRYARIAKGRDGDDRIDELRAKQAEGRDYLFGSVCAALAFIGVGAATVYLRSIRQRAGRYYNWVGSRSAAVGYAVIATPAPGLMTFHTSLADKIAPGVGTGLCVALAGLPFVAGVVGYQIGRRKQATGLLAVWTGFNAAVAACVFAGTDRLSGIFSGQGHSTLSATEYAAAVFVLWVVAGGAVFTAGQVLRTVRRRRPGPRPPAVTSSPS